MKKILILYLSDSSGHHAAANAVESGLRLFSENNVHVNTINALNYVNPILEKVIMKTYMGVVKKAPDVWEYLYDNEKFKNRISRFREKAHRLNTPKIFELIMKEMPDAVICTQAYPCGVLNSFKSLYGFHFDLYAVITDYVVHSYWILDDVDYYIVPCDEIGQKLIEKGIDAEKIKYYGIPVVPHFSDTHNAKEIRKRYTIDKHVSVVTIMGGGHGLLPMKSIVSRLNEVPHPIHIIAITGKNKKLYSKLKDIQNRISHPMTIFGYINNVSEIMEISDLLISKPGGMTTSEALIKSLPMIIMNPLPGQEAGNTEFLVKKDAAVKLDRVKDLTKLVADLFSDPERLERMKNHIQAIRKPFPTMKIANHVLGHRDVSLLEV